MKDIKQVEPQYAGAAVNLCLFCKHHQRETGGCTAYPDGIPQEILWMNVDHRQPYLSDQGIQFALREDLSAEMYDWFLRDLFVDTWDRNEKEMQEEKRRYAAIVQQILERRKGALPRSGQEGKERNRSDQPGALQEIARQQRQNISQKEIKLLCSLSGGVCAFPGCGKRLVELGSGQDDDTFLGEIAHIVADSRQGPRGISPLTDEERDKHTNLILLCGDHHKVIDSQPNTYSVSVLRQMKVDHEARIVRLTAPAAAEPMPELKREVIHSSLLPVTHLPEAVFSAPCGFRQSEEGEVRRRIQYPQDQAELVRFLLREEQLFTFHDLREPGNPFAGVIDRRKVMLYRATEMWPDAEGMRRYVTLLNRAMHKHADRLGIRFDPVHQRYFFPTTGQGEQRSVEYRPLNQKSSSRKVAWEPKRRSTGEGKGFWWHLAAALTFHLVGERQWCLSIRPERHLTTDGQLPLPPQQIGRRVTRLKARMYNDLYLGEVNFWRDYLSAGSPRFVLNFGSQSAVVDTQFIPFEVRWPGIPGDDKPFANQVYEDDLFTLGALQGVVEGDRISWDEAVEAEDDDYDSE